MSRRSGLRALALLLLLSACERELGLTDAPRRIAPEDVALAGRVVALLPGHALPVPVEGAIVRVTTPDGAERTQTTTDAGGRFALRPGLPPWELRLSADLDEDGLVDALLRVSSAELPLVDGADVTLGDLVIRQTVQLAGTVRRGDLPQLDTGHRGILVEVPGVLGAVARTNDEGQFLLERLPVGPTVLHLSAPGYLSEQLSLELPPGALMTLADVSLTPVAPTSPGSLTGTVLREDGGDGEVTIEALRVEDGRSVARLVGTLGVPWLLERLPPATYDVQLTVTGYGTQTLGGLVVTSERTTDAGTIVLRPGTVVVRDGAVASWEPASTQVLPALGAIRATLDVALDPTSFPRAAVSARLLRIEDADGLEVAGDQLYVEAGELLPDGSTAPGPTIWFSPRRPLAPGRYVGSLPESLRDVNGRAVQASRIAWICVGPALLHLVDGDALAAPDASIDGLRLRRRADGQPQLTFRAWPQYDAPLLRTCSLGNGGVAGCRTLFSQLVGGAGALEDVDVLPLPGGELAVARQTGAAARACPPSPLGPVGVLTMELEDGTIRLLEDPAGNPRHCARSLATLADGSFALYSDWSLGGTELLVRNDPRLDPETQAPLGFTPDPAVVQAAAPSALEAVPLGVDSLLAAWDGPDGDPGHRLFRLGRAGGLQSLPSLPLDTHLSTERPALCELDGQPMALLVRGAASEGGHGGQGGLGGQGGFGAQGGFGGNFNPTPGPIEPGTGGLGGAGGAPGVEAPAIEAFRLDPSTGGWLRLPPLVAAGTAASVSEARCARVGAVTFALAIADGQLRLAWWSGTRWEPIGDPDRPAGTLASVPGGADCRLHDAALLGGPDGVDVAWVESCFRNFLEAPGYVGTIRLRRVR